MVKGHTGPAGRSAVEQALRRNAKRMINTGLIFYEKRRREVNLILTRVLKFAVALYVISYIDKVYFSPYFANFDDIENSVELYRDKVLLRDVTNIFDSPLLKVRPNTDADLTWLEAIDDAEVAKLPNILGNSASHSDAKLVKLIYTQEKDLLEEFCPWYNHDPKELDSYTGLEKDGIWVATELEGTLMLDNKQVEDKMNNILNTKVREFTKASECCFACARHRCAAPRISPPPCDPTAAQSQGTRRGGGAPPCTPQWRRPRRPSPSSSSRRADGRRGAPRP